MSPIGDRLRVTRDRVMRKRLSQADRKRRTVNRKAHSERKTRASIRTNPVLNKGHPQDVAHPATAKRAEYDSETELHSVASLSETAHSQPLLTGSVTHGRDQTRSGHGRDPDGSRRRVGLEPTRTREQAELGRRSPQFGTRSGVPAFSFRLEDADDESNYILHFERGNLNAKVAPLKTRQTERYYL